MKLLLILLALSLTACSTPRPDASAMTAPHFTPSENEAKMSNLAIYAMSLYDTPYLYGGKSRDNGFDCSGFVQYVFQNSLGLQLPRTSAEMSRIGTPLASDQLKPGDLVFFNTSHSPNSHVGIYIGGNRFVHAPKTGRAIAITSLKNRYWNEHYSGARRIALNQ